MGVAWHVDPAAEGESSSRKGLEDSCVWAWGASYKRERFGDRTAGSRRGLNDGLFSSRNEGRGTRNNVSMLERVRGNAAELSSAQRRDGAMSAGRYSHGH